MSRNDLYPRRIVSLAPSVTEILFALGAGDRVVAVSRYCDFPPEAAGLPAVARYTDGDIEAIERLTPDLVVVAGRLQAGIAQRLIERDVPVLALAATKLEDVYESIGRLGVVTGATERALALITALTERVARVAAAGAALPRHPRVFIEEWAKPLRAGGRWLPGLVALAGGEPILPADTTVEAVAAADPELIVASWPGVRGDVPRRRAMERPAWQDVTAIRTGRVFALDDWLLHRPGPRLVDGLEALSLLIGQAAQG